MKLAIALSVILVGFQCSRQAESNRASTALSEKIELTWLEPAYAEAEKATSIKSFLVSHNNELVGEAYYKPYSSDSLDHVRSVTKSVISTLIGIAIDKKIIAGLDEPITTYFGSAAQGKDEITIRHLLTMTSGIQWREENDNTEFNQWVTSENPTEYVLNKPMNSSPGKVWNYTSGGTHLLSAILTEASGMSTFEFARKYLFEPLGITKVSWGELSDGYCNGGAGLQLTPRDMVRFGQLYANGGIMNGKRIISEEYVKEATSPQQPGGSFSDTTQGYGYCWWLGQAHGLKGYIAAGYGGQSIAVISDHNLVITITQNWRVNGQKSEDQSMISRKISLMVIKQLPK